MGKLREVGTWETSGWRMEVAEGRMEVAEDRVS